MNIFTIPSGLPFLESFAAGLLQEFEKDPLILARMEIFLPTRRAGIELGRSLLRQAPGQMLLLPKISPLGDLDEEEDTLHSPQDETDLLPLIPPFKRWGLLTTMIEDYLRKTYQPSSPALSLKLAKSLCQLMDQAAIEQVPWEGLLHLVPAEFAGHWQLTLDFLEIMTTHWPQILAEKGFVEPHTRHHQLVDRLIARWERTPPVHPIIAAGSTGTMPATARLLQAIAQLPQGAVILPGLDLSLDTEEAGALSPCHPQYAPTRFLAKGGIPLQEVRSWVHHADTPRALLWGEALKSSFSRQGPSPAAALSGVSLILAPTPQDEALSIAILLRQHLEIPDQRIAFVTADLTLAERVTSELKRWDIVIDRSAGERLDRTPPGVFVSLCAAFAADPEDPTALLSLLKHPLCSMGRPPGQLRFESRRFETQVLRGKKETTPPLWMEELQALLPDPGVLPFPELLKVHRHMAETLACDETGKCQLWTGPKGAALLSFFEALETSDLPPLDITQYPDLLQNLLNGQTIRGAPQSHPRLAILGPLEARLFHADVMILGGLNEGTWPPDMDVDPWLNRPMRREMGFPPPERRVGLSAHDFGQAFMTPRVYLTRALKVNGTPTLECRWVERLRIYLKAWGLTLPEEDQVLAWGRHLDQPDLQKTCEPPLPCPPVETRPRQLSVTQIETWMRDPYALYAKKILNFSPLDPLDLEPTAADKGTLMHEALDQFFKTCPDPHHVHALEKLLEIGNALFEPYAHDPKVQLFWVPRFRRIAQWLVETERQTRHPKTRTFTEIKGQLIFSTTQGLFTCTAKADRIDVLPDGRLRIIDYKTGTPPLNKDITLGFSPQLPLEGAIAIHQGFEGISGTELESLQFWWLKGDATGGVVKPISGDPHALSLTALAGLQDLVHRFDTAQTCYPARPLPAKSLKYNDYAHLARLQG